MKRQSFAYYALLIALSLGSCRRYQIPTTALSQHYVMQAASDSLASTPDTDRIAAMLAPYKVELDSRMNEVIGKSARSLPKRKPESPLGNWISDALQKQASQLSVNPVSASVQNYGGIRIPELPAGNITVGKIYELMPFDNTLVIVEMTGEQVQQFFDLMAADGGWPVSKEVQYTIRNAKAQGLSFQSEAIDPLATYYIAMPDYIANGGNNCDFLQELPRLETGLLIRDILIEHVRQTTYQNERIQSFLSGRVMKGS